MTALQRETLERHIHERTEEAANKFADMDAAIAQRDWDVCRMKCQDLVHVFEQLRDAENQLADDL